MMNFASGINRPPYETADGYLQTTIGCSHNHCLFCTYFKDQKFRKATLEEIESDIKQIPDCFGTPKRIFLQGADGYSTDYDTLMRVAELLHEHVPSVRTIGGYARIDSFYDKTEEQLRNLADAGYADPYIGVESGDDATLKKMNKGYNSVQAREQLEKLDRAGLPYIVNFLNGAGGTELSEQHAINTAKLYNGLHPTMVNMSMMTVVPGTPLSKLMAQGKWKETSEHQKLKETHTFVSHLNTETLFMNEHASNFFHVNCQLPADKHALLQYIEKFGNETDEALLRSYREKIVRAFQ